MSFGHGQLDVYRLSLEYVASAFQAVEIVSLLQTHQLELNAERDSFFGPIGSSYQPTTAAEQPARKRNGAASGS